MYASMTAAPLGAAPLEHYFKCSQMGSVPAFGKGCRDQDYPAYQQQTGVICQEQSGLVLCRDTAMHTGERPNESSSFTFIGLQLGDCGADSEGD